jgi:hypothetical protein
MINLIPKEEKKRMVRGFYYRLAVLCLIMIDFAILIALVVILPAYFISSARNSAIEAKLEVQKKEPQPLIGEQSLMIVKDVNNKLSLVENAEKNKFLVSVKVIDAVISNKRLDIKITQIVYQNDPTLGKKISLLGTAPSREVLLLFSQALADNANFKNVDLPISNFIKGSNIQFNLNLIPAQ